MELTVWHCLFIAILSTGLELIGAFGLDNLFITLGVAFFSYSLMTWDATMVYVVPIITAPLIIAAIIEKRALTVSGLIMAMIMDFTVSAVFGNMGFLVLISFFVGSLVTDKIKKTQKARGHHNQEGRHARYNSGYRKRHRSHVYGYYVRLHK